MDDFATLHAPNLRDTLRDRTAQLHESLHQHSSFVALFNQSLRAEEYRTLMARLYGYYAALDAAIAAMPPHALAGFRYEPRADKLAQDLRDLGATDPEIAHAPRCPQIPGLVTPATLGGVLYVIEGATLGGATIDRAAQRLLDPDHPRGRGFWQWCRTNGKHRWAMIQTWLNDTPADDITVQDLTAGALGTFQALSDWLAPLNTPHTGGEA